MYPKWVTRAHGIGPVLCLNEEEEAQLLADWEARDKPAEPNLDELRAALDERGIKYDKRWGLSKLKEALDA